MSGWEPKPGDWVTVLPLDQHASNISHLPKWQPVPDDPSDMQVGRTYRLTRVARHGRLFLPQYTVYAGKACTGRACTGYLGWCRPATPDEIRQAQLAQLAGGGL